MSEDNSTNAENAAPEVDAVGQSEAVNENVGEDSAPSREWLEKELAKVRNEAANYRKQRNEYRNDSEELKKLKDAEKSDLERSQERIAELEKSYQEAQAQLAVAQVANKYGIGEDDLDLLGTGTQEQLEARAARIAELNKKAVAQSAPPSNLPKENLVSGSGKGNESEDDAYPSHWR